MSSGRWVSAGPPAGPEAEPLRARILIVDDDERNLFAATSALEELGHEIVVAKSGDEALKRLLVEDFAVILLDLHMPGMDGYETAGYIRKRRRTSGIPIVFLTAVFRDEAHLFQAYSAGAVDVVFKPIDPFILRSKVQVLVDLHMKTVEVRRQAQHRERLLAENARVHKEKLDAELALRRSQERQQAILNCLPIVFHSRSIEPPYRPLFLSGNVEELTGFSAEAFLGQADFGSSRIHPDDLDSVVKAVSGALTRGSYSCEFRWRCADGEYRRFLDQGILSPPDLGGQGEIIGALLDVSERRSLEEQLAQARKMESVGQLTGGVAHDFNNLLTVIIGNLDLLARRSGRDERTERQLSAMRYAAERGRGLTRQLLAFSRRQHLSPVTLDVNALISNFAPLMKQAVGDSVTVELDLAKAGLKAHVDAAQLETALLNLAVNARDAQAVDLLFSDVVMPGGCNGVELARQARALRPELKVLLSSGYVGEAVSLAAESFELIDKPYERSTLAQRLAQMLAAAPSRPGRGRRRSPGGGRTSADAIAEDADAEDRCARVS